MGIQAMSDARSSHRIDISRATGRVLREIRENAGLSQEKLAKVAGLDRTYPSLIERGLRHPTIDVFLRICEATNAAPARVMRIIVDEIQKVRS